MIKAEVLRNIRLYTTENGTKPTIYVGAMTRLELLAECEKDYDCETLWGCLVCRIPNVKFGFYLSE